jgi:hypothetical protein
MGLLTPDLSNFRDTRGTNSRPKLHTKLEISTSNIKEKDVELLGAGCRSPNNWPIELG